MTQLTDAELAAELDPSGRITAVTVAAMKPEDRARWERLVIAGRELQLWEAGLGPKPKGVIVCVDKRRGLNRDHRS